jgi:uncharacterized protein with beta-barrel porin domain
VPVHTSASSVVLINGAQAGNVFFRVGSSATLGSTTAFQGKILALTSITLVTGASIQCGAALARNGAVTLDTNTIGICPLVARSIGAGPGQLPASTLGNAIDAYVAGGGTLPLGFQLLGLLTPAELATALSQISGEAGTGVAPASAQAMDSFLNLLNDRNGLVMTSARANPLARGTVSVLGYAPQAAPVAGSAFVGVEQTAAVPPDQRFWDIWLAGFGGYNLTEGEASVGSHDRTTRAYGVAGGIDYHVTPDSTLGFALATGVSNFGLAGGFGSGRSTMGQAAVYGRTDLDAAYIAGALAYAYSDVRTERLLTFAGNDRFTSRFSGQNFAGQIEAGYRMGWFTPYAALRGQAFMTPAYQETTAAGASTFALAYEAQTVVTARTEIGARINFVTELDDGTSLALRAGAGWAHDYGTNTGIRAGFQALPGSSFTINGATPGRDSLLLSAGAEIGLDNGFSLAGSLNGEFAQNSRSYGGTVKLGYRW